MKIPRGTAGVHPDDAPHPGMGARSHYGYCVRIAGLKVARFPTAPAAKGGFSEASRRALRWAADWNAGGARRERKAGELEAQAQGGHR